MGFLDLSNFKKVEDNYTEKKTEVIRKSQISAMTDREIQEEILKNNKSMTWWITFMGVLSLIGLMGAILCAIQTI
jgi:hypothetical protein